MAPGKGARSLPLSLGDVQKVCQFTSCGGCRDRPLAARLPPHIWRGWHQRIFYIPESKSSRSGPCILIWLLLFSGLRPCRRRGLLLLSHWPSDFAPSSRLVSSSYFPPFQFS